MSDHRASVRVRRATADDIDFIMRVERLPGYDELVSRWDADEHARALANPDNAYLIGADGADLRGFAIVTDVGNAHGNVYLRRVAILRPGEGFGKQFVDGIIDWTFRETAAHRFWLKAIAHNQRARRAYAKAGFSTEGVERQAFVFPSGERSDFHVMSILRPEWQALRDSSS